MEKALLYLAAAVVAAVAAHRLGLASVAGYLIAGVAMGVWPRGSLVFFLAVSSVYVLISLALGLLISATSKSAAEAVQRSVIFSIPLVQLSGFIFPISSMPTFLQVVTYAVPARYFLIALRAVVLKGVGPAMFWQELLALAIFAVVILGLASLRLRRQWT